MTETSWKKKIVEFGFAVVLVMGLIALVAEAAAGENRLERWTCTPVGLAALSCLESFRAKKDDPNCTKVSLTADMGNGTGTIQVTGMPMENTHFKATQFDRGWLWPLNDPEYAFGINHNRAGFYFPSLSSAKDVEPSATFHCHRESN